MQEELKHYVELLSIHRDALRILGKQLARFGDNAPTHKELEYAHRIAECTSHIHDSIELIKREYTAETEALSVMSIDLSERGLVSAIEIIKDISKRFGQTVYPVQKSLSTTSEEKPVELTSTVVKQIRKLIGSAETEQAIIVFILQTKDTKLYNLALLLSAQYKSLKREKNSGTISQQEFEISLSGLNLRLLELIE